MTKDIVEVDGIKYGRLGAYVQLSKVRPSATKGGKPVPFEIGKDYFMRTVTYHLTGRVIDIVGEFLVLEDAAWIADSGRFNEFIAGKETSSLEVEPFGDKKVFVNMASITDATERKLLLTVK